MIKKKKVKIKKKSEIQKMYVQDIFFLSSVTFFFIIITFWLITSKVNPPPDDIINKFPYIIQFFIRDQSYGIALIIYLPTMLMLFAFKKLVLYSFRH